MGQGHDSSQWPAATVVTNRDFTGMAHSAELADIPLRVEVLHIHPFGLRPYVVPGSSPLAKSGFIDLRSKITIGGNA